MIGVFDSGIGGLTVFREIVRRHPSLDVLYLGDTSNKFKHLEADALQTLGVTLDPAAKMPDVVVHDVRKKWLILVEAVATGGVIDAKRRNELRHLFKNSKAGL